MNIIGFIIDLKGCFCIPGQFDQGSRLEHGGERTAGRMPCGIADISLACSSDYVGFPIAFARMISIGCSYPGNGRINPPQSL